jgi:hypothetical protein
LTNFRQFTKKAVTSSQDGRLTIRPLHNRKRERAMRKTLTMAVLLLALSCPALAGEMHTPGAPTTPPPQPTPATASAEQEAVTTDEDATGATEILTQAALDLVSRVLSLL